MNGWKSRSGQKKEQRVAGVQRDDISRTRRYRPSLRIRRAAAAPGDGGPGVPTAGGVEICDGRDNDCDGAIEGRGVCGPGCSALAYGGHGYMLCKQTGGWSLARDICLAWGGDLATIGSEGENQFLASWIEPERAIAYIGGTDATGEGDWRWVDDTPFWSGGPNGTAVSGAYTSWNASEPDNMATDGSEGDCLVLWWTLPGEWRDGACTFNDDVVCEVP